VLGVSHKIALQNSFGCCPRPIFCWLALEDPNFVQPKIPRRGENGGNGLTDAVGEPPGIECVNNDIDGQDVEDYKCEVLQKTDVAPVLRPERAPP
jgi:hypothetical protein